LLNIQPPNLDLPRHFVHVTYGFRYNDKTYPPIKIKTTASTPNTMSSVRLDEQTLMLPHRRHCPGQAYRYESPL
jgi:hypothetical protein